MIKKYPFLATRTTTAHIGSELKGNGGFSLIEVLLAIAVFAMLATGLAGALVYGEASVAAASQRSQATALADEAMQVVKNFSDASFNTLTDGTYGLDVQTNRWILTSQPDTTSGFTRSVTISTVDQNRKEVTATVTWNQIGARPGSLTLDEELTNWQAAIGDTNMAGHLTIDTSGLHISSTDNTQVLGINLGNTGDDPITIDAIRVSWVGGVNGNDIRGFTLGGTNIWSGNKSSGTTIVVTHKPLPPRSANQAFELDFKKPIAGAMISLTFLMTDGTRSVVTGLYPQ